MEYYRNEYICEVCGEVFDNSDIQEHVKEKKHYTYKLKGSELILCFA